MLNQVVVVGRVAEDLELKVKESGKKVCEFTLAVPRQFKNLNGEYDTDFLECVLFSGIAENTVQYCQKGDLVGIKGRVQSNDGKIKIVAEKITFLSSKVRED